MDQSDWNARVAKVAEAGEVARLLHNFNTEFDTPSPGPEILVERLKTLMPTNNTFAILAGVPAVALALVTLRTNVWYEGRVALLDEPTSNPNFEVRESVQQSSPNSSQRQELWELIPLKLESTK